MNPLVLGEVGVSLTSEPEEPEVPDEATDVSTVVDGKVRVSLV
jgi:hypothetical protein